MILKLSLFSVPTLSVLLYLWSSYSRNDIIDNNGPDDRDWVSSKSSCDLSFQLIEINAGSNKRLPFQHSWIGHLENPTKIQMDWLTLGCWSRCVKSILLCFILFHLPLAHSCRGLQSWPCLSLTFLCIWCCTQTLHAWLSASGTMHQFQLILLWSKIWSKVEWLMETCECVLQWGANFSCIDCSYFCYDLQRLHCCRL